jgi:CubicO group peptidase (beta-lactamase class C family)
MLDAEMPAANGVVTARALARMYGAIANGGEIDGTQFLSRELVAGLTGRRSMRPDRNLFVPLAFHLGYHSLPYGKVMPGFGHVGLGGSVGWADPADGVAFALVHNRLLTPFVMTDHAAFVGIYKLIRDAAAKARMRGLRPVTEFGAPFSEPGAVAG